MLIGKFEPMESRQSYSQKTKKYYNQRFGSTISQDLNKEEQIRWNAIKNRIGQYFSKYGNENPLILDFGCGDGRFSNLLSEYGTVYSVDFAEEAIREAQKKYPKIRFYSGDASDPKIVELFNKQFDLLVSTEVIEHILDQKQYLQNIAKLLRSEGLLILTTPNKKWYDQYFEYGMRKSSQPYENWLNRSVIENDLLELGFEILSHSTIRSNWIFSFKTFGWLRLIGNRFFNKILMLTRLKPVFLKIADRLGLGIYLVIVAKKN